LAPPLGLIALLAFLGMELFAFGLLVTALTTFVAGLLLLATNFPEDNSLTALAARDIDLVEIVGFVLILPLFALVNSLRKVSSFLLLRASVPSGFLMLPGSNPSFFSSVPMRMSDLTFLDFAIL